MIRPDCIEVYPDRAAWLAARRRLPGSCPHTLTGHYRIGASDIGCILGRSPHGGPWDTWLDKREGRAEEDNADMAQGRRWERRVLEDYAEATGAEVVSGAWLAHVARGSVEGTAAWTAGEHTLVRHPEHPWATCSPDGFARMDPDMTGEGPIDPSWCGVECKAVMDPGAAALWAEETQVIASGHEGAWPAPLHYVLQVYWSLAVTGLPFWDLAAILMPRRGRLVYHRFLADPDLQAALLEQVGAWRQRHLVEGEEPPVDDSEAAWSYYASRDHAAPLREATEEERALALELARVQRELKAAEKSEARLKNELGQRLQGCAGVALGPSPGRRKKPPRVAWEGGGVQHHEAKPARTVTVAPHLRVRGVTEEDETP